MVSSVDAMLTAVREGGTVRWYTTVHQWFHRINVLIDPSQGAPRL
jgi:hypothetical protein